MYSSHRVVNLELQQGSCSHDREQASIQLNPVHGTVYQLSFSLAYAIKSRNESSHHICEVLESCLGVRGFWLPEHRAITFP